MTSEGPGPIDLLCAGRLGVDLYAEQEGSPLRGVESFNRYLGGSAANICVGVSRLGLRTAMCSRVGAEELGRFALSALEREGVDTSLVQVDPDRPSGLVVLALERAEDFPRIFYYRDSADLATDPALVDASSLQGVGALLLTGSFLTSDRLVDLSRLLAEAVKGSGGRVVLDVDFRPVLFGLVPVGRGNEMAAVAPELAEAYGLVLPYCDLVVGTEAELQVASGRSDPLEALRAIRALTKATIVLKQGERGALAFEGEIPSELAGGVTSPPFEIAVVNTVGAGDGFMSGFLSGWLRDRPLAECIRRGNASGAIVATRPGCTPAMPFAEELERFLALGGLERPDEDHELERLHRLGARPPTPEQLCILAIDHRWQLEDLADGEGVPRSRIARLKELVGEAYFTVAATREDVGILVDDEYGGTVLERAALSGTPLFRSLEVARSRPVELVCGEEAEAVLHRWPAGTTAKVNVYLHPDDDPELTARQTATLARVTRACRAAGRELLVELQPPPGTTWEEEDFVAVVRICYEGGARPEWWKLPPSPERRVWQQLGELVRGEDPTCRGLLVLGSTAEPEALQAAFAAAVTEPACRGFAVGRAIFAAPAAAWVKGELSDQGLVQEVAERYRRTIDAYGAARSGAARSRAAQAEPAR